MPRKVSDSLIIGSRISGDVGTPARRLREYDQRRRGLGHWPSIYSTQNAPIPLLRARGLCRGCGALREVINGYCATCRALGANELQCEDTRRIT